MMHMKGKDDGRELNIITNILKGGGKPNRFRRLETQIINNENTN